MARLSDLSDELLVKIISFLPTKEAVSTSVLSKQWEFLWMWLPKLEFYFSNRPEFTADLRDFIAKNLPLHKAPIIESLGFNSFFVAIEPEDLISWVGTAVSRCVPELSIDLPFSETQPDVPLPSCLYSSNSLVTLKLGGEKTLVDVPPTVCLPSLKTLELQSVTYSTEDSLRLLLSYCPVLEDLNIDREDYDNLYEVVINVPSLLRLTLTTDQRCFSSECVIRTPSLKSFNVIDYRESSFYLIDHMPELVEADIRVMLDNEEDTEELLKSITTVKRLTFRLRFEETVFPDGIVFSQLENLKLYKCCDNWSKLLVQLLKDSPNLQFLNVLPDDFLPVTNVEYEPVGWSGSVPKCFSNSLESFKFEGYDGEKAEDRDFLSLIFKHARCLKSASILNG